jgi:hypothetical protein
VGSVNFEGSSLPLPSPTRWNLCSLPGLGEHPHSLPRSLTPKDKGLREVRKN